MLRIVTRLDKKPQARCKALLPWRATHAKKIAVVHCSLAHGASRAGFGLSVDPAQDLGAPGTLCKDLPPAPQRRNLDASTAAPSEKTSLAGGGSATAMQQLATLARLKSKLSPVTVDPTAAFIEATSHCQLRCPSCPTALKKTDAVLGRGYLTPETLMRILEAGPRIRHVELSNWGEAFLNSRLPEILRVLHERGIRITIANGANLNNARDEALEAVVRYQVSNITCSIDGASSETYKEYRRGGNFNKVMANIEKINRFKKRYGSKYPKLAWQFVIFGHNQHEIDKARQMAKELNMDIEFKMSWECDPELLASYRY